MPDVAIQADCRLAIEALHAELARRGHQPLTDRIAEVHARRNRAIADAGADAMAPIERGEMPLPGKSVVHMINEVFGDKTILVKENGGQDLWVYYWPYYQVSTRLLCVAGRANGDGIRRDRRDGGQARPARSLRGQHDWRRRVPDVDPRAGHGRADQDAGHLGRARRRRVRLGPVDPDGATSADRIVATDFEPDVDLVAVAKASGCDAERLTDARDLRAALERAKAANDARHALRPRRADRPVAPPRRVRPVPRFRARA